MLARTRRLQKTVIEKILKKGRRFSNIFFTVKYLPSQTPYNRFCVIISTKVEPKATKRNRLRRQLYEIFRHYPSESKTSHDVVFIVKNTLKEKKYGQLETILIPFFQHLNRSQ